MNSFVILHCHYYKPVVIVTFLLQIIELTHSSCIIGSTSIESFRQQAWLAYENFFFENYSKKLLKFYQVSCQCCYYGVLYDCV